MKNAFLSFLESFASSRSAAALDRNRDAFFVKGRAKLTNGVSLRRPQTSIRQSASSAQESASRRSGSYSFVSTRSKVKFLLFFRIVGNFTIFHKKSQAQTVCSPFPLSPTRPKQRRFSNLCRYFNAGNNYRKTKRRLTVATKRNSANFRDKTDVGARYFIKFRR